MMKVGYRESANPGQKQWLGLIGECIFYPISDTQTLISKLF